MVPRAAAQTWDAVRIMRLYAYPTRSIGDQGLGSSQLAAKVDACWVYYELLFELLLAVQRANEIYVQT